MDVERNRKKLHSHRVRPGDLHGYLSSRNFNRLTGRSTMPGVMLCKNSHRFRDICIYTAEIVFLLVGLWYVFR